MYDIIASIVTYKNDTATLSKAITSFLNSGLKTYLYVIDNSPTDTLKNVCAFKNVEYIFNNKNVGFGSGHNMALRRMFGQTKYSLVLNPDVYFEPRTLEQLFDFMEKNQDVGLVLPKVLYPDGSLQYLCRLLPNPCDMLLRKIEIKFLDPLLDAQKARYELKFADYNTQMEAPYLSGCFMFLRTSILEKTGIFDERFFIYFEDVDLSRRIHKHYRTVYFPDAVITHGYARGSNKDSHLLKHLVSSGIKYFNKWGWFFDNERKLANTKTIQNTMCKFPSS